MSSVCASAGLDRRSDEQAIDRSGPSGIGKDRQGFVKWLLELHSIHPVAHGLLVLCTVAALGLAIGSIKIRGVGLGVAGVLFAGILLGHFRFNMDPAVRTFIQEFGLVLFVYTIGMQVGPGFLASLRKQGLPLNFLAAGIVLTGAVITVALCLALGIDLAAGVGLFAGATTNTPALGASQQALAGLPNMTLERAALPGLGYAICYPFGIVGIILSMLLVRTVFNVNIPAEVQSFLQVQRAGQESLHRMNIRVENSNLDGQSVRLVPGLKELGIVLSRHRPVGAAEVTTVTADTVLHCGDTVLAVGTLKELEKFRVMAGRLSNEDLLQAPGQLIQRRVVVTHKEVLGKTPRQLALDHVYGVAATRVIRAEVEITASADLKLQFGDMLQLVGTEESIRKASALLGNSIQEMNRTKLIPIFVGLALGVMVGSYPFVIGNVPVPVGLGLAGGPLLAAIALSRIGRIGPLLWYMPENANTLLRELGIVLFLSSVGLRSGVTFFEVLFQGSGFLWMGCGVIITLVPLLLGAWVARAILKVNFVSVCGLLSGSMTDPPALAFANSINNSDAPSVAYATVYPLTMLLRILVAQLMVILFSV